MHSTVCRLGIRVVLSLILVLSVPVLTYAADSASPGWNSSVAGFLQSWVPWVEIPWWDASGDLEEDGDAGPHTDPHGNTLSGSPTDMASSTEDDDSDSGAHVDPHG